MENRRVGSIGLGAILTGIMLLSAGLALAEKKGPEMTPELAAKREQIRKQQDQRITPEKRKAAVDALKAERMKIHLAREANRKANPGHKDK